MENHIVKYIGLNFFNSSSPFMQKPASLLSSFFPLSWRNFKFHFLNYINISKFRKFSKREILKSPIFLFLRDNYYSYFGESLLRIVYERACMCYTKHDIYKLGS